MNRAIVGDVCRDWAAGRWETNDAMLANVTVAPTAKRAPLALLAAGDEARQHRYAYAGEDAGCEHPQCRSSGCRSGNSTRESAGGGGCGSVSVGPGANSTGVQQKCVRRGPSRIESHRTRLRAYAPLGRAGACGAGRIEAVPAQHEAVPDRPRYSVRTTRPSNATSVAAISWTELA